MSRDAGRQKLLKQAYYCTEIAKVVQDITDSKAKLFMELVEALDLNITDEGHLDITEQDFQDMHAILHAEVHRLTLLSTKLEEQSCCPIHFILHICAAFMAEKLKTRAAAPAETTHTIQ